MKTKCITRFKLLRTQYKLSISKFAKILNMKSPTSITNIEKGRALPSVEMIYKIISLFGVSVDWLMGASEIQYNESLIASIEEELKTKPFIKNNTELLKLLCSNKERTIEQRSHIIFKLQYLELEFNEGKEKLDQLIIINLSELQE